MFNEHTIASVQSDPSVSHFTLPYPSGLYEVFRKWVLNRGDASLDAKHEHEAKPLLQMFLGMNQLVWNEKAFGQLKLSSFQAHYIAGHSLVTPKKCYVSKEENIIDSE